MADVTRKRQGEMLRALFAVLHTAPEGLPASEALKRTEKSLTLTPFEQADFPKHPGVRRFEKLLRFATIGPVKAGWLVKDHGTWSLTDAGWTAYETFTDPAALMQEAGRLYVVWRKGQPSSADLQDKTADSEDEPDPAAALEDAEDASRSQIEAYLAKLPPYDFQLLVAGLLRAMGYDVVWVAPPGPDGGFDILAQTDPLGARGPRIQAEVKRRPEWKVGRPDLNSFLATLGTHDIGIYISTGGFTKDAETEARHQENRRITLIDLQRLLDLWVHHYSALPETDRQLLPLKPVWFLAVPEKR